MMWLFAPSAVVFVAALVRGYQRTRNRKPDALRREVDRGSVHDGGATA